MIIGIMWVCLRCRETSLVWLVISIVGCESAWTPDSISTHILTHVSKQLLHLSSVHLEQERYSDELATFLGPIQSQDVKNCALTINTPAHIASSPD